MENIKWQHSEEMVNYINANNIPILAIVGATGAGKSTLASYLELEYAKLKIIRNNTTRAKRYTDCAAHFRYISENEFERMMRKKEFFISRYLEPPFYGYSNIDLQDIIDAGKIPVFMFRHSGTKIITNIIKNVYVILIECDYNEAVMKSKDVVNAPTFDSIEKTYSLIDESLKDYNGKVLRLRNSYDGNFFTRDYLHDFIKEIIND